MNESHLQRRNLIRNLDVLTTSAFLRMAQSTASPSSAPSTASDSGSSSVSQTTITSSDPIPYLPKDVNKSSMKQFEPEQPSPRSLNDLLPSNPSRRFSDPYKSCRGATDMAVDHNGRSRNLATWAPTGEEGEEEGKRRTKMKRHSHHGHINGYTECGRHGDDWLFGGFSVIQTLKEIFKK